MAVRYITVSAETNMFKPATRSYGDIAIIGNTVATAGGPTLTPIPVTNPNAVSDDSNVAGDGLSIDDPTWFEGDLGDSVNMLFKQSPGPSKVYAVRADVTDTTVLGTALDAVAKLNVQLVTLANTPLGVADQNKPQISALSDHVVQVSQSGGDGKERMGIAMLNKGFVDTAAISGLTNARMVMVAHNSDEDAAAAFTGTIAGYEPHISILLKAVNIDMPEMLSDSDIDSLNTEGINWLTRPDVMPGMGIYAGEAYTLDQVSMPYIDIVRTIDDVSFRLKARLIVAIGKLRVSRAGLKDLASMMAGVLEPLRMREVIEGWDIIIPVSIMLDKDPNSLTDVELQMISNAQNTRTVEATITVDYAGAIHRLNIKLIFD